MEENERRRKIILKIRVRVSSDSMIIRFSVRVKDELERIRWIVVSHLISFLLL